MGCSSNSLRPWRISTSGSETSSINLFKHSHVHSSTSQVSFSISKHKRTASISYTSKSALPRVETLLRHRRKVVAVWSIWIELSKQYSVWYSLVWKTTSQHWWVCVRPLSFHSTGNIHCLGLTFSCEECRTFSSLYFPDVKKVHRLIC